MRTRTGGTRRLRTASKRRLMVSQQAASRQVVCTQTHASTSRTESAPHMLVRSACAYTMQLSAHKTQSSARGAYIPCGLSSSARVRVCTPPTVYGVYSLPNLSPTCARLRSTQASQRACVTLHFAHTPLHYLLVSACFLVPVYPCACCSVSQWAWAADGRRGYNLPPRPSRLPPEAQQVVRPPGGHPEMRQCYLHLAFGLMWKRCPHQHGCYRL